MALKSSLKSVSKQKPSRRQAQLNEVFGGGEPREKPSRQRRRREIRGLWKTTPAYKCARALFLTGAALTAISYAFIHVILTDPWLMSRLLRYPVPQGSSLTVSSDADIILYGCGIFTVFCLLVMILIRWRRM